MVERLGDRKGEPQEGEDGKPQEYEESKEI